MSTAKEPVGPRVRLAIARWPEDAPRGTVTRFCEEHQISRKTFYEIRARARVDGQAAALEPRSRRTKTSPTKLADDIKQQAIAVRAALESSGLDHGPISVQDRMRTLGLELVPSIASLARIFREAGVARLEPKKRPRASWRRFVFPAPNACWQLDATEYVLTGGRKCVILQLIDDHSRYAPTRERLTRPPTPRPAPPLLPTDLPADTRVKKLTGQGTFYLDKVHYKVGGRHGLEHVLVITHADNITITDLEGGVLAQHTRPAPAITYVGNGLPRGPHPNNPATSPKS